MEALFVKKSLFMALLACLVAATAFAAPNARELKNMSTFLSNFTELGYYNLAAADLAKPEHYDDAVRFGIWHNYINNFKSMIHDCKVKNCPYGTLTIKVSDVKASIKRYFGVDLVLDKSAGKENFPFHLDGGLFHFQGADGEAVYYASVKDANKNGDVWTAIGDLYNPEDKKDVPGRFTAHFRDSEWNGKKTYVLIDIGSAEMK